MGGSQHEAVAKRVGEALNPFFIFTVLFALAAAVTTGSLLRALLFLLFEGLAAGVVILYVLSRTRGKKATDFWLPLREERILPAVVVVAAAVGLQALLAVFGAPQELLALVASILVAALLMALLTFAWKASAHAAVAGNAAVWGPALFGVWGIAFMLIVPAVVWARVTQRRHTLAQSLVGAGIGALVAAVAIVTV